MISKNDIAVVIDIGSTKTRGLAGSISENNKIEILGHAIVPSKGIKRGVVLNIEEFSATLRSLIEKLEEQAGIEIRVVDVSMAGQAIQTMTFEGIRYTSGTGIVSQQDIDYLFNEAKNMPVEPGNRIYHIIPQTYTIDDEPNISNPIGHAGRKVHSRYKLITGPKTYKDNVEMAFSKINVQVGRFFISTLATAEAVANEDEKEAGVAIVDIGSGTTKMSVYINNQLAHTAVIPFAGDVITNDIREGCGILARFAEQLKIQYGQALGDFADEDKVVTIAGGNGWESKEISFKNLAYIIQARLEEIIDSIMFQIEKSGMTQQINQGIILTGGTAQLKNILQILKFRTGLDARLATSEMKLLTNAGFNKNDYITALGLIKLSLRNGSPARKIARPEKVQSGNKGFLSSISEKFSQQISLMFNDDDGNMQS
ncbi:cell division protein FtsA [Bacteroidales bacterium 6E]|nr:cell division protein FtsA [Bacteroidales bacterium 6E]